LGTTFSTLLSDDIENHAGQANKLPWLNVALMVVGGVLPAGAGIYLVRAISGPLNKSVQIAVSRRRRHPPAPSRRTRSGVREVVEADPDRPASETR
jgi:hypothetical protein